MSCNEESICSLDVVWLWYAAPVWALTWEILYAAGAALKNKQQQKNTFLFLPLPCQHKLTSPHHSLPLFILCKEPTSALSFLFPPPPPSPTPFSWGFSNRAPKNSSLMKVEEAWSKLLRRCGVLLLQARSQLQNPEERRDIPTLVTFCTTGSKSREDKEMSRGFYGSTMPVTEQESWMSWSCRPTQLVNHQWD